MFSLDRIYRVPFSLTAKFANGMRMRTFSIPDPYAMHGLQSDDKRMNGNLSLLMNMYLERRQTSNRKTFVRQNMSENEDTHWVFKIGTRAKGKLVYDYFGYGVSDTLYYLNYLYDTLNTGVLLHATYVPTGAVCETRDVGELRAFVASFPDPPNFIENLLLENHPTCIETMSMETAN